MDFKRNLKTKLKDLGKINKPEAKINHLQSEINTEGCIDHIRISTEFRLIK